MTARVFIGTQSAGSEVIENLAGDTTQFLDASTADKSHLHNYSTGATYFYDMSTAGSAKILNSHGGTTYFLEKSTAGNAEIHATESVGRSNTIFLDDSNAGHATISNDYGRWSQTSFYGRSTAGDATIVTTFLGYTDFYDQSTAGQATLISFHAGTISFHDDSTAGYAYLETDAGWSSFVTFYDRSTAGYATISNSFATLFEGRSSASNATITNTGSIVFSENSTAANSRIDLRNGSVVFLDDSHAGTMQILSEGVVAFEGNSSADSALIKGSGNVYFGGHSTPGSAQLVAEPYGLVDFSGTSGPNGDHKITAGSIAGAGTFYLGANELTVGSNGIDTNVSGSIVDGGIAGGVGGSIVKVGAGTLILSGYNTYTGGTTIDDGVLQLGTSASAGHLTGTMANTATVDVVNADLTGLSLYNGAFYHPGSSVHIRGNSTAGNAYIYNNYGQTYFYNQASAGSATFTSAYAFVSFDDDTTAASATIHATYGYYTFNDRSTAATAAITTGYNGGVTFNDSSKASHAAIANEAGGETHFTDFSNANFATITNSGVSGPPVFDFWPYGITTFSGQSTAGYAAIVNNYRGVTIFDGFSSAGAATITTNADGETSFRGSSNPDDVNLIANAGGVVDFSATSGRYHDHQLSARSISGAGTFFLGANTFTVGSYGTDFVVSGSIQDGGAAGGSGGSLIKVGGGTMTLSGNSTYTGGTTIVGGKLVITSTYGAGSGPIGFTSGAQTLALAATAFDSSGNFLDTLSNFDSADTLELEGLDFVTGATALLSGNTLTVNSGGVSNHFTLSGNYDGRHFVVVDDGSEGSAVHLLPVGTGASYRLTDSDGTETTERYNSAGQVTSKTIKHSDGSHDEYSYSSSGQPYSSEHVSYDSTGRFVELDRYAGSVLVYRKVVQDDGTVTTNRYDDTGREISKSIVYADGSHDEYVYNIRQPSYDSEHATFGADGKLLELDRHLSGQLVYQKTVASDGTVITDRYDSAGRETSKSIVHVDGSSDQFKFVLPGKPGASEHAVYGAGGILQYTDITDANGSHTIVAYAPGITLSSSVDGTADSFKSYGSDTFLFKPGSGNDVISNFHAGNGSGHDTIDLTDFQIPDFAHLQTQMSSPDHFSTLIALSATDTLLLKGVAPASLTVHDFVV